MTEQDCAGVGSVVIMTALNERLYTSTFYLEQGTFSHG